MRRRPIGTEEHTLGHVLVPKRHRFPENPKFKSFDGPQVSGSGKSVWPGSNNDCVKVTHAFVPSSYFSYSPDSATTDLKVPVKTKMDSLRVPGYFRGFETLSNGRLPRTV